MSLPFNFTPSISPASGTTVRSLACCNVFFPCEETGLTISGSMRDISSGVIIQPSLAGKDHIIANGSTPYNTVYPNSISNSGELIAITGSWPDYSTKSVVVLAVARVMDADNARIPIGNGTAFGFFYRFDDISVSFGGGMHILCQDNPQNQTGSTPDAGRTLTNGQDVIIILQMQRGGNTTASAYKLDGNLATDPGTPSNTLTQTVATNGSMGSITPDSCTRVNGLALYGWATFVFNGTLPFDVLPACFSMANNWTTRSTNRSLYAPWSGLT